MLNVRKLRQDFSSSILKEGKDLFDEKRVVSAKILHFDTQTLRISARVMGQFNNAYESEIEIDRSDCETIDSDCDCPYHYDCQHLAALLYYLEEHLDEILVTFSNETDIEKIADEGENNEELLETLKQAQSKEEQRKDEQYQKQLLHEYVSASDVLAKSPFFLAHEEKIVDRAELAIIFQLSTGEKGGPPKNAVEINLALRLPSRSKPLHIPHMKDFLEKLRHEEPLLIGGRQYLFALSSFSESEREIARMVLDYSRVNEKAQNAEKSQKIAYIEVKSFGMILAKAFSHASSMLREIGYKHGEDDLPVLPCLYEGSLECPLKFSPQSASFSIGLEFIDPPVSKILLNPALIVGEQKVSLEDVRFFECGNVGMIYNHVYYGFAMHITRQHVKTLESLREVTIPEPLFGTFVENGIPELANYAQVENQEVTEQFVTLPFVGSTKALCNLSFLDGELEAQLEFNYEENLIPASMAKVEFEHLNAFITKDGILARNLVEERKICENLFGDFIYEPEHGTFISKSEKKIVEFMTEIIPQNQDRVTFNCPQNLLDQFIYDQTKFTLSLSHTNRMDVYEIKLDVDGSLKGVKMERLWECVLSRKAFIELDIRKKDKSRNKLSKILVLDLEKISAIVQIFDELGIQKLENHTLQRPLWSIANIDSTQFEDIPVTFTITDQLTEIRKQMLGEKTLKFTPVPKVVKAELRGYQKEGMNWLERLRKMFLSGILADDMGLGKTLQAIVAITQLKKVKTSPTLIVCPTSLLYNWKEEFGKFNPKLKILVVDGIPTHRKKLLEDLFEFDVIITSYSLLQKDVEQYKVCNFHYMILDEAQHIKNRGTRNAKSVKQIAAKHRLILSGTPIENSLDELWSLFDFLMPGFLSSYDRFVEKYIRVSGDQQKKNLEYLRKKISPFILRRMKEDVLDDLPPVSEIPYHCQLSDVQQDLYKSYAESARDELTKLVARDGFDKVQIHVLATLTRLKQICCHPAIFAKDSVEPGDSAKYDMLLELLDTLIEGGHKTVIFSQYTKMLQILRRDFEKMGVKFSYLDGSSKNRLEIVNEFNEDKSISVFLVSLKAGGTGLNLVGADTVIHYDMWWNPAVENQATDRVHRMGQKQSVSVYKLVTLGTIEEKIVSMQQRKQGLVKKVVSTDDEAMSKLTWEDVLELLQT